MSVQRYQVVLWLLLLLCVPPMAAQCEDMKAVSRNDQDSTLGSIDDTLFLRFISADPDTVRDLYINHGGLYLTPNDVTTEGDVNRVCVFGYLNQDFASLVNVEVDNVTRIDFDTNIRPFVYVMLYRPLDAENKTVYRKVGRPAVVHHFTSPGCISRSDGLDWQVKRGDRIGAFISDNCTSVDELLTPGALDAFLTTEVRSGNLELLCPSQINLALDAQQCFYAYYLDASEMELAEVKLENFVLEQTRLNLEVFIKETSATPVVVGVIVAVVCVAVMCTVIVSSIVLCRWSKKRRAKQARKSKKVRSKLPPNPIAINGTLRSMGGESHSYEDMDSSFIMSPYSAYAFKMSNEVTSEDDTGSGIITPKVATQKRDLTFEDLDDSMTNNSGYNRTHFRETKEVLDDDSAYTRLGVKKDATAAVKLDGASAETHMKTVTVSLDDSMVDNSAYNSPYLGQLNLTIVAGHEDGGLADSPTACNSVRTTSLDQTTNDVNDRLTDYNSVRTCLHPATGGDIDQSDTLSDNTASNSVRAWLGDRKSDRLTENTAYNSLHTWLDDNKSDKLTENTAYNSVHTWSSNTTNSKSDRLTKNTAYNSVRTWLTRTTDDESNTSLTENPVDNTTHPCSDTI